MNHKNILISKLFGIEMLDVVLGNYVLDESQSKVLETKLELLSQGLPLDYVVGWVDVLGLRLNLDQNTLIPREETQWWLPKLADYIKSLYSQKQADLQSILVDIGTGSGLVGLYLSRELDDFYDQFYLVDIDPKTLAVAQKNYIQNEHTQNFDSNIKVNFLLSDGLEQLLKLDVFDTNQNCTWTLVANLPYVPLTDKSFAKDYNVSFEPELAIYSGIDGLDLFRKILGQITSLDLRPSLTVWELDPRNIKTAQKLLENLGYSCEIWLDESGLERVLVGEILL